MVGSTHESGGRESDSALVDASGVIVLGPGRSGTSAITYALVTAGFFAGREEDLYGPIPSNQLGHFESLAVLELNEEILKGFGCHWWADAPKPDQQLSRRNEIEPRLRSVVESLIASAGGAPIVLKEPRINGLLPLWGPVIENHLHPVLAVRDPLEVAFSHRRRDGTSTGHALAAWEYQTTLALGWLEGRRVTVAPYARLLAEPELMGEVVREAVSHLDPELTERLKPEAAPAALRSDLRNEDGEIKNRHEYLTQRQSELWAFLQGIPPGDTTVTVPVNLRGSSLAAQATMQRESEWVALAEAHATLVKHLTTMNENAATTNDRIKVLEGDRVKMALTLQRSASMAAQAEEQHQRELATIRNSWSWRLTAPMRAVKRVVARVRR